MNPKTRNILRMTILLIFVVIIIAFMVNPILKGRKQISQLENSPQWSQQTQQIIQDRRMWDLSIPEWIGKTITDFDFQDTNANQFNIADFKGKKLLLILWATWCGPCKEEIPHLIALRKIIPEDELAIVAFSNEDNQLIKDFQIARGLNYTIASLPDSSPEPLISINGIPAAIFIDKNGVIKFATVGTLNLGTMKTIINDI